MASLTTDSRKFYLYLKEFSEGLQLHTIGLVMSEMYVYRKYTYTNVGLQRNQEFQFMGNYCYIQSYVPSVHVRNENH
jgi:hypothetical protein